MVKKISPLFMILTTFFMFSCTNYVKIIESKTHLSLVEKFDNDSNKWQQINNREFLVKNDQGSLYIEKFKRNRVSNGCLWYKKSFDCLNTANDFAISFDAKFISYDDVYNAFDFQWGDWDSISYMLSVNVDGRLQLKKFNNTADPSLRWTDIASNNRPDLIKKNDFNNIYIIQLGEKCIILVNNKVVFNVKMNCRGNQIGFQECLKVAWEFDNFKIRSTNKDNKLNLH